MESSKKTLEWLPELKISPKGIFKYIVIKVSIDGKADCMLVRGDTKY